MPKLSTSKIRLTSLDYYPLSGVKFRLCVKEQPVIMCFCGMFSVVFFSLNLNFLVTSGQQKNEKAEEINQKCINADFITGLAFVHLLE